MEPCGYYLDCDDAVCTRCATEHTRENACAPVFSWDECDYPVHCVKCADLLPVGLTEDGRRYVAERLSLGYGAVVQQWSDHWPELAPSR